MGSFFNNASTSASKMLTGELSLIYPMMKHRLSYNSMNCGNKLTKEIFRDSETAKKLQYGRTKAEAIILIGLAPKSVKDFVNISSTLIHVREFGINFLDFIEQSDESANRIYKLLKQSVEQNGLDLRNVSSYSADNAFVNYGKHQSITTFLKNDNENMLKANCSNHVLHNSCRRACESLSIDIEVFVLKLYGHFTCSTKIREALKSFFLDFSIYSGVRYCVMYLQDGSH
ncbi:hypothetical protein PR048_023553 [Dryococelus australis]|uniref:DUF4371 domain-containing protein n=1 Tax=Dryococelus australis TaxID=614101 RepID=A0ABQ9GUF7_9NEOP|nr:hypothetical protein PR048_023553 [Dryococelus australis]